MTLFAARHGEWQPSHISGLKSWWKASRGYVPGITASWTDLGPYSKNVTQSGATAQPFYSGSNVNLNNRPSLTFDGSNDKLQASTAGDWTFLHSQPVTIGVAMRQRSMPAAFGAIVDTANGFAGGATGTLLYITNAGNVVYQAVDTLAIFAATAATAVTTNSNYVIVGGCQDGASTEVYLRINGAELATSAYAAQAVNPPAGPLTFGGLEALGTNLLDCEIAEVVIYGKQLNSTELRSLEQYLGKNYGITIP